MNPKLNGIPEIRTFFRTNTQPIYFFGPTAFNLLGIDRWVRNFQYVVYYDSWDGAPPAGVHAEEQALRRVRVERAHQQLPAARPGGAGVSRSAAAVGPMIAMVFFDEETEEICAELGLRPDPAAGRAAAPARFQDRHHPARQRGRCSVGAERARHGPTTWAELPSCPRAMGSAPTWWSRRRTATRARRRSSSTAEADWDKYAEDIVGQELKVMKRIDNKAAAVEACITRHGTIVGPFMTDLTGYPELTPYKGGWCGNDLFPEALSPEQRATAIEHVRRLGDRLAQEGYKGFLEIDVLVDLATDEVYLGELNPRISGASSMTNVTAGAYADVPLFLFHLLEFMDVDYTVDVEEINERWRELAAVDVWSQLIMKEPHDWVELILAAPRTGTWHLDDDGSFVVRRRELRLARRHARGRGVLPAGLRRRRLPLQGRRPRHPGHQGPDADREGLTAMPPLHRRDPVAVRHRADPRSARDDADRLREVAAATGA